VMFNNFMGVGLHVHSKQPIFIIIIILIIDLLCQVPWEILNTPASNIVWCSFWGVFLWPFFAFYITTWFYMF
jgi:hypothetical protein